MKHTTFLYYVNGHLTCRKSFELVLCHSTYPRIFWRPKLEEQCFEGTVLLEGTPVIVQVKGENNVRIKKNIICDVLRDLTIDSGEDKIIYISPNVYRILDAENKAIVSLLFNEEKASPLQTINGVKIEEIANLNICGKRLHDFIIATSKEIIIAKYAIDEKLNLRKDLSQDGLRFVNLTKCCLILGRNITETEIKRIKEIINE